MVMDNKLKRKNIFIKYKLIYRILKFNVLN